MDYLNQILNNPHLIPDLNNIVYSYWLPTLDKYSSNEIKIKAFLLLFNTIDKRWRKYSNEILFTDFILNNYRNYFNLDECNYIINVLNNCTCCKYHIKNCVSKHKINHICLCYCKQLKNIIDYFFI